MKQVLILVLASLFTLGAQAATPAGAPVIGLGGVGNITASGTGVVLPPMVTIDAANSQGWFQLVAGAQSITSGNFYPFYKNGALYQVTTGKTASCVSMTLTSNVTANAQLVSSTATFANNGSLTGPVYQSGVAAGYTMMLQTAGSFVTKPILYDFAALTWPGIQCSNATNICWVDVFCREH